MNLPGHRRVRLSDIDCRSARDNILLAMHLPFENIKKRKEAPFAADIIQRHFHPVDVDDLAITE